MFNYFRLFIEGISWIMPLHQSKNWDLSTSERIISSEYEGVNKPFRYDYKIGLFTPGKQENSN